MLQVGFLAKLYEIIKDFELSLIGSQKLSISFQNRQKKCFLDIFPDYSPFFCFVHALLLPSSHFVDNWYRIYGWIDLILNFLLTNSIWKDLPFTENMLKPSCSCDCAIKTSSFNHYIGFEVGNICSIGGALLPLERNRVYQLKSSPKVVVSKLKFKAI